ncbi:MAG: hypothetical protein LBQ50_11305 [Planctomycetaceae bacterium]|jgi:hypothetical protein|nr:hypothetical protein [Planctomycetaceae bacterium]
MNDEQTWLTFLLDGRGFHKTVRSSPKRPNIFTPDIVQNIAAMAIEKYFMAVFLERKIMPMNHTMTDLISTAQLFLSLEPELVETLYYMDHLQQICSFDHFKITTPSDSDVPRFLKAVDDVAAIAERELFNKFNKSNESYKFNKI